MKVRIIPGGEERIVDIKGRIKVKEILGKLGLSPEGYVVTRNGEILTEEDLVDENDVLEVYRVVSGG